jgi:methionine sulfoxide reductase heme-binding subunit
MDLAATINAGLRRFPVWPLYVAGAAWAAWLFWLGLTGGLGVEPINALEREYGAVGLKLLVLGLTATPLRKWTGVNLLKFRRAIGLLTFFFITAHFAVWALLDVQSVARIWQDILKRPYVTVGMTGFVLMIPLALTSNNMSIRKMGAATWRRLHRLAYPVAILGVIHFLWLSKGFQLEPLVYLLIVAVLLVARIRWNRRLVNA